MNVDFIIDKYLSKSFWSGSDLVLMHGALDSSALDELSHLEGGILFQTSGTSGQSKWVIHTRDSILISARSVNDHLNVTQNDVWYLALPVEHVGGFGVLARSYLVGSRVVLHQGRWGAQVATEAIKRGGVTLISLVSAQVVDIVDEELICPDSVRAVIVGGGSLENSVKVEAIKLGWPIYCSYGMSETGSQIATQRNTDDHEIELIHPWEVRCNRSGYLEVKGEGLFSGYLTLNKSGWEFINPKRDGWFTTQDLVEINDSGLIFKRRGDRQVKILGELVDVLGLESKVSAKAGAEVVIIDVADVRRGVILIPVIELRSFDVELWGAMELAGLERLEQVQLCDNFPRNEMGKLNRMKLRDSIVFSDN